MTSYKDEIQTMMNDNYKEFIEALISIEKNIEDKDILAEVYDLYLKEDFNLINDRFDELIKNVNQKDIANDTKEFNPHIKFWTSRVSEYERLNTFTKEKENMYRVRLPKESKYSEYSLDTKLQPKNNPDGKTSYITIDKDFQYKLIAPAKDGEKLDWTKKQIKKVSGYELKLEFEKDKSINNLYKSKEKESEQSKDLEQKKDNKTKAR